MTRDGIQYPAVSDPPTPVWVNLDHLFPRFPDMPRHPNGAGVEFSGVVPGVLFRRIPAVTGEWMGLVDYTVPYADGRPPLEMRQQLVPFDRDGEHWILRPRTDDPA
ncbi:hypothetical protein AB0H71_13580 [Nocardia sp. NPDC050697]|uniref:hypothetical protein n=1 Tax=Nocardia sp. NPDC050697 TaxID=3155158 RepID=UPI0033EBC8AB